MVKWPVHCNQDEVMLSSNMKMGLVFGLKFHLHKIQWIQWYTQGRVMGAFDWYTILIGPGDNIYVISHLTLSNSTCSWVGLKKQLIRHAGCDKPW